MNYSHKYLLILTIAFCYSCSKEIEKITPTYTFIDLPNVANPRSVNFLDAEKGFIAGGKKYETGLIWQTQDGGNTWQFDTIAAQAIHHINIYNQQPILGTTTGRFFTQKTNNQWQYTQSSHPQYGWSPLYKVAQTNDTTLFAITGGGYHWGSILKSEDKGNNWQYFDTEYHFFDLQMLNHYVGYACGFGAVYKTIDAGNTWQLLDLSGDIYKALYFVSENIGYIVGDEGSISKTTDGGSSFIEIKPNNSFWNNKRLHWNDIQALNEHEIWIVGDKAIWRTENGGAVWEVLQDLPTCNYKSIYLFSSTKAITVGNDNCVYMIEI